MKRRLLNVLTVLSLLLCGAVVTVWPASYWAEAWLEYAHAPAGPRPVDVGVIDLAAGHGNGWVGVAIFRDVYDPTAVVAPGAACGLDRPPRDPVTVSPAEESFLGFAFYDLWPGDWRVRYMGVCFPLWLPALVFGSLPSVSAYRWIWRGRRRSLGHCPSCGYDLRAHPGPLSGVRYDGSDQPRPMKRRLLNLLTLLSLLLLVASAAGWVRAYFWYDIARGTIGRMPPTPFVEFKSEGAAVSLTYMPSSGYDRFWYRETGPGRRRWFGDGFHADRVVYRNPAQSVAAGTLAAFGAYYRVQAPFWALVVVGAILPATQLVRHLRRRPPLRGICARCGYDLRATPDRCPECGESSRRSGG